MEPAIAMVHTCGCITGTPLISFPVNTIPQVKLAESTTKNSRMPVLCTVPMSVIRSSTISPMVPAWKVLSFRTGLPDLIIMNCS